MCILTFCASVFDLTHANFTSRMSRKFRKKKTFLPLFRLPQAFICLSRHSPCQVFLSVNKKLLETIILIAHRYTTMKYSLIGFETNQHTWWLIICRISVGSLHTDGAFEWKDCEICTCQCTVSKDCWAASSLQPQHCGKGDTGQKRVSYHSTASEHIQINHCVGRWTRMLDKECNGFRVGN